VTGPLWDVARTLRARVRSFFDAPPAASAAPLELLSALISLTSVAFDTIVAGPRVASRVLETP